MMGDFKEDKVVGWLCSATAAENAKVAEIYENEYVALSPRRAPITSRLVRLRAISGVLMPRRPRRHGRRDRAAAEVHGVLGNAAEADARARARQAREL